MPIKRSNRGQNIDMDALIAANKSVPAVGNMNVNAAGDVLGPDGTIVKRNEERVRDYYKQSSSSDSVSLKGEMPKLKPDTSVEQPKTSKTAKENVRTQQTTPPITEPNVSDTISEVLNDANSIAEPEVPEVPEVPVVEEPEEFDAPEGIEPVGYKEVELPNGDIEMVPVYKKEE